ncbi:MAG: hypothetical protein VYB61_02130 [Verrucomicrobiota bacterium]|nr:hypothetical protein [Verrucomicrobiota bacterium]
MPRFLFLAVFLFNLPWSWARALVLPSPPEFFSDEQKEPLAAFEKALNDNATQHEDYLKTLNGKYIGALEKARQRMLKIKATRAAVALDGEIGRIESGDSSRSAEIDSAPDYVRTMRGQYEKIFARVNSLKQSRDGEARFAVDRNLEMIQVALTRANKIDDALATRNFRDLLQKASRPRVSEKPPEKAPEDVPVDPGVDPPVDPGVDPPVDPPFNPGTLPPVVPDTAYRDDVPRPMTTGEREKYAAALGPAPQKSGRGYAVMLASIQRGEVKSIKASSIKGWGVARPQIWNSKPYWTATVTYPTTSLFGTFDTEGMAIISGNRVVEWLYTGSGEEIP